MKFISLIIFILIFYSSTDAQGFQLSARDGFSILSFPAQSDIQLVYFTKFSFSVKYNFDNKNKVDLRLGYLIRTTENSEDYAGPELGLYYQRVLLNESGAYGFAGINTHTAATISTESRVAVLASAGLGLPLGRIVSFEIIYNKAIQESYDTHSGINYEIDLGMVIKFESNH